jgi:hypothetical protein
MNKQEKRLLSFLKWFWRKNQSDYGSYYLENPGGMFFTNGHIMFWSENYKPTDSDECKDIDTMEKSTETYPIKSASILAVMQCGNKTPFNLTEALPYIKAFKLRHGRVFGTITENQIQFIQDEDTDKEIGLSYSVQSDVEATFIADYLIKFNPFELSFNDKVLKGRFKFQRKIYNFIQALKPTQTNIGDNKNE